MAKKDELNFESDTNKMASSEKLKALQAAMDKIEKNFGKGSIMKMGDNSVEQVEVIPTGSIALNAAKSPAGPAPTMKRERGIRVRSSIVFGVRYLMVSIP